MEKVSEHDSPTVNQPVNGGLKNKIASEDIYQVSIWDTLMRAQTKEDMVIDQTDCLVNMALTERPPGKTGVLFLSLF